MTIKEYVGQYGYKVSDLTNEELEKVKEELEFVNDGGLVLDSVLSTIGYRRKESN